MALARCFQLLKQCNVLVRSQRPKSSFSRSFSSQISSTFEGKVPPELLKSLIYPNLGVKNKSVLVGPNVGIDGAVVQIGDTNRVVVTSDPVTGSIEDLGTLSVICNANDIAVMGAVPEYMVLTLLIPPGPNVQQTLKQIMTQVHKNCTDLGISVIGGHTEITKAVTKPLASVTMFGKQVRLISPSGASPGDLVVMTKSVSLEGTLILLSERENEFIEKKIFSKEEIDSKKDYLKKQLCVVPEALLAIQNDGVTAMHDPTEGGLSNAIVELMEASQLGCELDFSKISIREDTKLICDKLNINPLNLISSGTLLLTVKPNDLKPLLETFKNNGIEASEIGTVHKEKNIFMKNKDGKKILDKPETDALWEALVTKMN